jgi:hypothetical protein
LRAKEDKQFKLSICGAGVVVSTKHLPSPSKQESSSTVELEIGGVAAPESVSWSWSPAKHALTLGREEIPKARQDTWKFGLKQPTMFELGLWADSI